jgi:hypothetical protein
MTVFERISNNRGGRLPQPKKANFCLSTTVFTRNVQGKDENVLGTWR